MKTRTTIVATLLLAGLAALVASVFAVQLGLDRSAGWGKARSALLAAGICLLLCSAVWWRYHDALCNAICRLGFIVKGRQSIPGDRAARIGAHPRPSLREYWFAIPLVMLILAVYVWLISGGSWINWVSATHYYADLARGFARGNLFLAVRVDPDLLNSPNPYEPMPNGGAAGPTDLSLYHGRFYLYWGPVPALVLLFLRPLINWRLGDLQLVFLFTTGLCILQCLFAVAVWDRSFKDSPKYLLWIALLVIGLAGPVPFTLNTHQGARIYEVGIMGGQFFLLAGILVARRALRQPISTGRLILAGSLWSLAVGSRVSLLLTAGIMALLTTVWILQENEGSERKLVHVAALCSSLALGLACLGWYNWARFGSVLETGLYYQLPGSINLQTHYRELVSPVYVLQNLYNYLLNVFDFRSEFPFLYVLPVSTKPIFPSYPLPKLYRGQAVTGLAWIAPFVVFAISPAVKAFRAIARKRESHAPRPDIEGRLWDWTVVSLSAVSLAAAGVLLAFFWCAMRYMEDFMPSLTLLSILGFWTGYRGLSGRRRLRTWYAACGMMLAGASIIVSTLIALSINDARFMIIRLFQ